MSDSSIKKDFSDIAVSKGYDQALHHIFLCTGNACAPQQENLKQWDYLKEKVAQVNNQLGKSLIARSKADCLRICAHGPLALVYPAGAFVAQIDEQKIDRLCQGLAEGAIPEDLITYQLPFVTSAD